MVTRAKKDESQAANRAAKASFLQACHGMGNTADRESQGHKTYVDTASYCFTPDNTQSYNLHHLKKKIHF